MQSKSQYLEELNEAPELLLDKQFLQQTGFKDEYDQIIYLQLSRPDRFRDQIMLDLIRIFFYQKFVSLQEIWIYFIKTKAPLIILNSQDLRKQNEKCAYINELQVLLNEVNELIPYMRFAMYINGIVTLDDLILIYNFIFSYYFSFIIFIFH
ncbi:hypothetical protein pb186bvf_008507 [Paramecium bursaria]